MKPDAFSPARRHPHPWLAGALLAAFLGPAARATPPAYDHVVIVIEENENYSSVIGNAAAPYINALAGSGALFTNTRSVTHPSHPNYLEFYSGNNQGVTGDGNPASAPFSTANLGAALRAGGRTFTGYAEGLPAAGDILSDNINNYVRRHCPWVWWITATTPTPANRLPPSVHQPFTAFPTDFTQLPTVAIVVPNNMHNMHDTSVSNGDTWLQTNLGAYATWAPTHNSLFVVVWDEDYFQTGTLNQVPMIFSGANVRTGANAGAWTLHNLLRTLEDMYALPHAGSAASVAAITGSFTGEKTVVSRRFQYGVNGYTGLHDTMLNAASAGTAYGSSQALAVLGGAQPAQSLIRFDNIFGTLPSQVPADAPIISAKLALVTDSMFSPTGTSIGTVKLHRMLQPWTESSTWTSFVGGISTDGIEALAAPEFTAVPSFSSAAVTFDVTASGIAWQAGANNYGWTIQSADADDWSWNSKEGTYPPTLDVSYLVDTLAISTNSLTVAPGGTLASFTVTRIGDGAGAVTLSYNTANTQSAQAGSDYTTTNGVLSWASGETGVRTIQIPIIADTTVEGNENFNVVFSGPTGPAALIGNTFVNVIIAEPPIDVWRFQKFGASNANGPTATNDADPDQDGRSNLLEYAFLTNPLDGLSTFGAPDVSGASGFLALTFRRNLSATDLTYTVQVSDDLATWHDGSTYSASGTTAANAYTAQTSRTAFTGYELITVRDNAAAADGLPHFIRLQLTLAP